MGLLIGFVSGKGGAGKTTITEIVATGLNKYFDYSIAVVEVDTYQPSMTKDRERDLENLKNGHALTIMNAQYLKDRNKSIFDIHLLDPTDLKKIAKVKKAYDIVFVDVPGSLAIPGVKELFYFLDYAFIPFYVDPKSFNSQIDTIKLISKIMTLKNSRLKDYAVFFNKYNGDKGKNARYFRNMAEWLDKNNIKRLAPVYENLDFERLYSSTINPPEYLPSKKSIYVFIEDLLTKIKLK